MNSITIKAIFVIFTTMLVTQSFLGIVIYNTEYDQLKADLHYHLEQVVQRIAYHLDRSEPDLPEAIEKVIRDEMIDKELYVIELFDSEKKRVVGVKRNDEGQTVLLQPGENWFESGNRPGVSWGSLSADSDSIQVYADEERLRSTLSERALELLMMVVSSTLLISGTLFVIAKWLFVSPLAHLTDKIQQINDGATGIVVDIDSDNEVGRLARSFNRMLDKQNRLISILENTSDFIGSASTDGTLTYVNRSGRQILGLSPDEDCSRLSINAVHPESVMRTLESSAFPVAIKDGVWEGDSIIIDRVKNEEILVSQVIMSHASENSATKYLSTIIRDISERKKIEEELEYHRNKLEELVDEATARLRLSESEYRQLYDSSIVGLWRSRVSDGRFLRANNTICSLFGMHHPGELVDKLSFFDLIAPEDRVKLVTELGQKGRVYNFDLSAISTGATETYLSITVTMCVDEDYIEGAAINVTPRKLAEVDLENTNRQLLNAAREAGKAEVTTSVLHDVGNVLNSIGVISRTLHVSARQSKVTNLNRVSEMLSENKENLIDFLSNTDQGKKLPVYLEILIRHLMEEEARTGELLEELVGYVGHVKEIVTVQQTQGRRSELTQICSISELVDEVLQIVQSGMDKDGIEIIKEYDDLPLMILNRHMTIQIVLNLLSNARAALSDCNPANRRIVVTSKKLPNDRVSITVCDNGSGIDLERQNKIFQYGFTTKPEGHGFGLHGAVKTAQELDGSLTFVSEGAGHGASFTLELPFRQMAA